MPIDLKKMNFYVFLISYNTNQTSVNFSESSILKKCAYDTHFSDEFLDFSETTASFSSLDTLGDAPWSTLSLSSLHL